MPARLSFWLLSHLRSRVVGPTWRPDYERGSSWKPSRTFEFPARTLRARIRTAFGGRPALSSFETTPRSGREPGGSWRGRRSTCHSSRRRWRVGSLGGRSVAWPAFPRRRRPPRPSWPGASSASRRDLTGAGARVFARPTALGAGRSCSSPKIRRTCWPWVVSRFARRGALPPANSGAEP